MPRLAAALVLPLGVALLAGCGPYDDVAPVPPTQADRIESARASLQDHWEGALEPTFAFLAIRCRSDGGALVLFAQRGPFVQGDLAVAMQGGKLAADQWSGGYGSIDPRSDPDIVAFFAAPFSEVPCPD